MASHSGFGSEWPGKCMWPCGMLLHVDFVSLVDCFAGVVYAVGRLYPLAYTCMSEG